MRLVLALMTSLLILLPSTFSVGGGGQAVANEAAPPHGEAAPPGDAKPAPPKKPKPKPKRLDKDRNCQWETDIDIDIDNKKVTLSQSVLKNVMRGSESTEGGYTFFADIRNLVLKIKTPEDNWYVADMTRLGDPNEGCVFYMVGEPLQVDAPPPLF